jgi:Uma2 family endonuclease
MSTQTRLLTADEFLAWPDEPGMHQKLIRGEVVSTSLPGGRHGEVACQAGQLLGNHIQGLKLGKIYAVSGCIIERDPDTVRAAYVSFLRAERLHLITDPNHYIPFAPDLALEVIDADDRYDDIQEKIQLWLKAGSLLVWSVDPESQTVTVYRPGAEPVILREDQEIDGGDVIPGFHYRVADFFA